MDPEMESVFIRHFEGIALPEEEDMIRLWISESEDNKKEYEQLKYFWEISSRIHIMQQVDVDSARKKVKSQIRDFKKTLNVWYYWQRISAVLAILLIPASILFFDNLHSKKTVFIPFREITSAYGVRNHFNLPDGSEVWLNSGSKIKFPEKFSSTKRELFLEGEAFFNVVKNPSKPFYVNLGEVSVKALGTSFNIAAYKGESTFETTLLNGNVQIVKKSTRDNEIVLFKMAPNQHAVYKKMYNNIVLSEITDIQTETKKNNQSGDGIISPNNRTDTGNLENKYTSWVEGKLFFRNDRMDDVVKRLERWYNVDIVLQDSILYDFRYNATFIDETFEQVLDLLVLSAPIEYTLTERKPNEDNSYSKKLVTIKLKTNY